MTEEPFKLGIVVLAYHRPAQLVELLRVFRHPKVTTYLHIDESARIEQFQAALDRADVGTVVWVPRHRSRWGSVEIVDAELEGLAAAHADRCSFVLVISGEDFPLKPIDWIVDFAQTNRHRSFLHTFPLPSDRWKADGRQRTEFYTYRLFNNFYTCVPRSEDTSALDAKRRIFNWSLRARSIGKPERRFPSYLKPIGGHQWLNLSADAVAYVLKFVERHPDYRAYHRYTACPDEIFIQSILLGSDFAAGSDIVNDDLRFLVWEGGDHPKTLAVADLPAIEASQALFARKVVSEADPELFTALRTRIGQPAQARDQLA